MFCAVLLAGCAWRGPAIDRYQPVERPITPNVAEWGEDAWSNAQLGNQAELLTLLRNPPDGAPAGVTALTDRYLKLKQESESDRVREARSLLRSIADSESIGDAVFDQQVRSLADLHVAGVPDPDLAEEIATTLAGTIPMVIAEADLSADARDWPRSERNWNLVEQIALAINDADLMKQAQDQQLRVGRFRSWLEEGESPSGRNSIAYYIRILEQILYIHVEDPDWREISLAGLDEMILRADLQQWRNTGESHPDQSYALLKRLRTIRTKFADDSIRISSDRNRLATDARLLIEQTLAAVQVAVRGQSDPDFQDLARAFIAGAASATDHRTQMIWPERTDALNRALGNRYAGIGTVIDSTEGRPRLRPLSGSPARKAGVRNNDILLAVNGEPTSDQTDNSVVRKVLGEPGSSVELTLEREGVDQPITLTVIRETIDQPSVVGWQQRGINKNGQPSWDWLIEPQLGIVYTRINTFTRNTEIGFRTAMHEAAKALGADRQVEGLILDLRDNTGGSKLAATRLIDLFLNHGKVFSSRIAGGRNEDEYANTRVTRLEGMPTVILVNELSASASELLAGYLQGEGGAVVIGERSYGKGSVQSLLPIASDGGVLIVTVAWYEVPDVALDEDTREQEDLMREIFSGGRLSAADYRMVERFREPGKWGVIPQLTVGLTDEQRDAAADARSRWYSQQGLDFSPRVDNASESPVATTDQPLLLGLALLEARIGGFVSPAQPDN